MAKDYGYVERFGKMGFGMFVHYGLYSVCGRGEWAYYFNKMSREEYDALLPKFKAKKDFAKELVAAAKSAGCKYISLTTRHHDGFSLYDTRGLSDYDVMHTPTKRDLVKEFTDECYKNGITPIFYHTLMDWRDERFEKNFKEYLVYLRESVKLLCTEYGNIGGFWFDGGWDKTQEEWEIKELYALIRKYRPEAMIINNTGLGFQGKVSSPEIDSVTFERGKPAVVDNSDRPRAGEMCQIMNNNWGYSAFDVNYKSVSELIGDLVDCRKFGCNYLLNVGPMADGTIKGIEKGILSEIGKWIEVYGESVYDVKPLVVQDDCFVLRGKKSDYLFVKGLEMIADEHLNIVKNAKKTVLVDYPEEVKDIAWIDNGEELNFAREGEKLRVRITDFPYGMHYCVRVARIKRK